MTSGRSPQAARPRCAHLVGVYPSPTHTFILNEVRSLRDAGVTVETISLHRAPAGTLLSDADRREFARTHALRPVGGGNLVRAHASALRRSPAAYTRTMISALRESTGGLRKTLWQLFYFAEAMLLWRWLDSRAPRHVHVHHASAASDVAMLACRFANRAGRAGTAERWTWSLTIHGPDDFADPRGRKLALKAREAEAVICVSDFGRREMLSLVEPGVRERIRTVHCGIDLARFAPAGRGPSHEGRFTVLAVAQLTPRKGIDVLLDALGQLAARRPAVRAVVVGDGPQRAELEARARELGIADGVTFAGAVGQDRILEHYRSADVFCLPSHAEGVPVVLMEAMALELPVVATAVMGVPELVEDGRCGLLVPPGRADLLAQALDQLAVDPNLGRALGQEARRRVAAGFERQAVAAELLSVLAPLIAPRP